MTAVLPDESGEVGVLAALSRVMQTKAGLRKVRTPEGREKYDQPIGTVIVPDLDIRSLQEAGLDALRNHPVNRQLGDAFARAGHPLFLVGGSVRDALAGHPDFADLDYTTDATPEEIHTIVDSMGPVWTIGEAFGTVAVQIDGLKTEITTFRTEKYDEESRKPVVAFGDKITDDLRRRDLTMNALALTLATDGTNPVGSLVDPHDGATDLAAGVLRTPDDPHKSMSEDPLRQLRVVRFAAKRGASPEPGLAAAIRELSPRLEIVATERKTAELRKILDGGPEITVAAMEMANELGVSEHLFGGLDTSPDTATVIRRLPPDADAATILAVLAARTPSAPRLMTKMRLSAEEIRPAIDAARIARQMSDPDASADVTTARGIVRDSTPATLDRAFTVADALAPRVKSRLSLEDRISVAEEAMERGGLAGEIIGVPPGHLHHPDPEKVAALMPLIEWARAAAASEGYDGWLNLYADQRKIAKEGAQAFVQGGTTIVLPDVTTQMTILHEVAHVVTNTEEGSHTARFVEVAGNLYERYLGPEAAQTFRGIAGGNDAGLPQRTPLQAAVGAVVDNEDDAVRAPLPIDGNDLLAVGLKGPEIGAALGRIKNAFLADPQLTRVEALGIAVPDKPIPNPDPDLDLGDLAAMMTALSGPPSPDGRPKAVIFDRDGTLASVPKAPTDSSNASWAEYNAALPFDRPVPRIAALLRAVPPGVVRIMVSGRAEGDHPGDRRRRFQMQDWIAKHKLPIDELFMRSGGDMRRDSIVKEELLTTEILEKFDVRFAVDDRPQVLEVWEKHEIPTLAVVGPDLGFPIEDQMIGAPAIPPARRFPALGVNESIELHVRPADEERVAALLPHAQYGPGYVRGVVDGLRDYSTFVSRGQDEDAERYLADTERFVARRTSRRQNAPDGVVAVLERVTDTAPVAPPPPADPLTAPLSPAARAEFDTARSQLPHDPDDWFPYRPFTAFAPEWREERTNGPGPASLEREAEIRSVGQTLDDEVARRLKAARIALPISDTERSQLRKQRQALDIIIRDRKEPLMTSISRELYGKDWIDLEADDEGPASAKIIAISNVILERNPDLAEMERKSSAILDRLVAPDDQYSTAYATALESVLSQIRPMGGQIDAKADIQVVARKLSASFTDAAGPEAMPTLDEAKRWWSEDLSMELTHAAVNVIGGIEGWTGSTATPSTEAAARLLMEAAQPLERQVYSGHNQRHLDLRVGATFSIPLMPTTPNETDARQWARFEDPLANAVVYVFERGARGVNVHQKEDVITGRYVVTKIDGDRVHLRFQEPLTIPGPGKSIGGPNSGIIPFQWRHQGPWDARAARPVNIDRVAMKDYNTLTPQNQKRVREAIRALEQGGANVEPKTRALKGTYGVRIDKEARMLVYPHIDGTWHIYAILPTHDYNEAERRMSGPADPAGAADFLFDTPEPDPDELEALRVANATADAAIAGASRHYPASWIDRSNAGKYFFVGQSNTGRGFYMSKWDPDEPDGLFLGNNLASPSVAIHELAHRMEKVFRPVTAAEWAFHWRRTSKEQDIARREPLAAMSMLTPGAPFETEELARPDKYIDPYVGKDYGDGPFDSYEVLSMGLEGIWTGSQPIWKDDDYRHFIVGLLAAV